MLAFGAVVSAGLLVELAAPAAGFTLGGSSSGTTSGGVPTSTATTTFAATTEDLAAALAALAAGGKTLGGPGTFEAGPDGTARIFQALTGVVPNLCVTVRNLSNSQIRISVNTATSTDVDAGISHTACVGSPFSIDLRCRQGTLCRAVWRVDRL
jgi:hypothetical protein